MRRNHAEFWLDFYPQVIGAAMCCPLHVQLHVITADLTNFEFEFYPVVGLHLGTRGSSI